jgi:hypothetical protein
MAAILQYSVTQNYKSVWADHGSHANLDVGFWKPDIDTSKNFFFGHFAESGYDYPTQSMAYVSEVLNDDPANPALTPPSRYEMIWGYITKIDFAQPPKFKANIIWNVVPKDNYVACGSVVSSTGWIELGKDPPQPDIPGLRCVRYDLATAKSTGLSFVWNDKGSGNDRDVSAWMEPDLHNMLAQRGYDRPAQYYQPNNLPTLPHNYGVP